MEIGRNGEVSPPVLVVVEEDVNIEQGVVTTQDPTMAEEGVQETIERPNPVILTGVQHQADDQADHRRAVHKLVVQGVVQMARVWTR